MPFKILVASFLFLVNSYAFAQKKPVTGTSKDSTNVTYHLVMDDLNVTPRDIIPQSINRNRITLAHGNPAHKLIAESELTTTIPGVTANLERDLPGLITFYMANGIPILTKQTQNHALTPSIPYSGIDLALSEPTAALSGPDAVITLRPTYKTIKNITLNPLHLGASLAGGENKKFSAALVAEHTSPILLEDYIEELDAYAQTTSGLVATRFKTQRTKLEVMGQFLSSNNEFEELFDVKLFQNTSRMYAGFATATQDIGPFTLEAGYGQQHANVRTKKDEVYKELHGGKEKLLVHSYKFGVNGNRTSLAVLYHDMERTLLDTTTRFLDTQIILTRKQPLADNFYVTVNGRTDHHDNQISPSASVQFLYSPTNNFMLTVNAAHLYDPIISKGMSGNFRDATNFTKPITTQYASIHSGYSTKKWQITSDVKVQSVALSWYDQPAEIRGAVFGSSVQRTFWWEHRALTLRMSTRVRLMKLDVNDQIQQMPGPTPFMGGFRAEYATDGYGLMVDTQIYSSRTQSLEDQVYADLGGLLLLNFGLTKRFGPVNMGLSIGNSLGLFRENKLVAYQLRTSDTESEIDYIVAPFVPGVSVGIDL
ncbi:MAG TPA: hypothetical protein VFM80_05050 [Gracilimonas sp.]|uniref:hypothetical protein n=1 Tax=Gracilimonas sp. TaxID=1974203 RepID=UPI002D875BBF|nr:hypothetical protein [Gracilimonas sp.]